MDIHIFCRYRHIGGAWKMAKSVEKLASRETILGTYDINLKKIRDKLLWVKMI